MVKQQRENKKLILNFFFGSCKALEKRLNGVVNHCNGERPINIVGCGKNNLLHYKQAVSLYYAEPIHERFFEVNSICNIYFYL